MTTSSREFAPDLVRLLRAANAEYANAKDPIGRRKVWIDALDCVMRALLQEPTVAHEGLLWPLDILRTSLVDLDSGTPDPALEPQKPKHRPRNPRWVRLRANAAAASELLKRNGATAADADEWVARRLNRFGYRLPGSRGVAYITAATIKAWRKVIREASCGDLMRDTFELWMRSDVQEVFDMFRILDPYLEHDKEERLGKMKHTDMVPALMVIKFIRKNFSPLDMA